MKLNKVTFSLFLIILWQPTFAAEIRINAILGVNSDPASDLESCVLKLNRCLCKRLLSFQNSMIIFSYQRPANYTDSFRASYETTIHIFLNYSFSLRLRLNEC